ncbi:trypsin-like peptidase domain-containing protein [Saccharothrix algeriensis]|uniref:Trypsin-like peptidase domain-containing protein n=1 Tax=Saccharothrix algeriensis TaxID=173560 RepID=A0ABS2SHT1_9PSEU|nr:serine protease [Saccharothrix algeriensis]MBM7815204.1 hypothetical protein [Saccharothrix algeriensis]
MARLGAVLGAVALLGVAMPVAPPAAAQPAGGEERAAAVARPGVVLVSVTWHGWVRDKRTGEVFGGTAGYEVRTSCSGAVISPDGYVATASRCVHTGPLGGGGALFEAAVADLAQTGRVRDAGKARAEIAQHGSAEGPVPDSAVDRRIQVERVEARGTEQVRDVAPAAVVDLVAPEDGDVAVLKVPRERLPSLEIRSDPAPVGAPVLAIGHPAPPNATADPGTEPVARNGRVTAHRTQAGRAFHEFDAADAHGTGGGPVVDLRGGVVGLISRGPTGEARSPGLAASARTLVDVLAHKGIAVGIGQHDRDYRAGLDRYFEGDHDGAVEHFDAVLAGSPGHRGATEHRRLAVEGGGEAGGPSTLLAVLAALCGGIAVATATAGTAVALARRKRLAAAGGAAPPTGAPPAAVPLGAPPTAVPFRTPPAAAAFDPPVQAGPPADGRTGAPAGLPAGLPVGTPPPGTPLTGIPPAAVPPPVRAEPAGGAPETVTRARVPVLPVGLGVHPQERGEADPDQAERREGALGQHQPDDETERGHGRVQPGPPLAGHPGADQAREGDGAQQGAEEQRR